MAGILSKDTTLSYKASGGSTFTEIPFLMEVPEMGGDPEKVEVTTLKDGVKKYIPGIRDLGDLAFKFLYDNATAASNYRILRGLQDSNTVATFKVEYPDGTGHQFDAYVNVKMDAASVNAAMTFTCSMSLQSDISVTHPTATP
ncbi:phage tail protein [Paenibacillus alvei]|uniref:phage tail tube protein n=1 Tax=Paenibacillus alvei TaxID=44250 RepID=UPI0002886C94|nr:phage tail tube protein [Paenibacillus alvei]EJW14286.1 phage tail protein [Paenibacillus alvei DSM 29]MCY9539231.1 phage tail protein [Paenibacillus alvei]MCY9706723.1 phage tail protein [Paenibacillus alvei]MCY9737000.1 phage tail protein [Paenibacillus alvei]MCY9758810.1 phage tail protein [Paenibacillus alvei]